jgi:outer membrane protein OmpA-like peptidoglycan-associated protein
MAAAGLAGTAIAATAGAAGSTAASQGSDDHHAAAATATGGNWQPQPVREPSGGFMFGTVLGVVGLIIGAALLAWFISSRMGGSTEAAPAVAAAAPAPAPAPAATPAPAPTPPEGSGVIATEVGGKPMVSVYFDTASAEVHSDFATSVAPIIAWLAAHPEDMAQVSGFNDPRGNAAFNADLSRRRAEGVAAQLRELGVPDQQIDLEPPASATDATTDLAGARRVEITVVPLS